MARVAVLGAGLMGSAAVERLASQGFEVVVWNRTRSKAEEAAGRAGARVAGSVEEAVSNAEAAIAFLADDEALMSVAARIGRADGLVFIDSSTVTPEAASRVAEYLEGRGACYVEAPVLGGPNAVREGRLVVIEAGRGHCKRLARPYIEALAERVVDAGEDPRVAQALKLAFNQLLISSLAVLSEAMAMAQAHGAPLEALEEVYRGTVFEALASKYLKRLASPEWPTSFRIELAAKDLDYARRAAWSRGLAAPVTSAAAEAFKLAAHSGLAGRDYSRIYWFIARGGV
ncbi:MAG: NAD(P)-dependent oxidoreductase [Desulfurococcales archaeon]|nr:NAD(P)-dependent oxidoreductase [Desulfurococcales archaeon]